jgi:hypothetical protein
VKTSVFVDGYDSIIAALSIGGAKRLSGMFHNIIIIIITDS